MKKLEEKILKKIYKLETKKTFLEVATKTFIIIAFLFVSAISLRLLIAGYMEQRTFDVLEIFSEDMEVIKQYMGETLETFYIETPRETFLFFALSSIALVLAVLTLAKNFEKIRNRIEAIVKFWNK